MSITISSAKTILSIQLSLDTVVLNLSYMAKSKVKTDYVDELCDITRQLAKKLTVKQLKQLIAKHEQQEMNCCKSIIDRLVC